MRVSWEMQLFKLMNNKIFDKKIKIFALIIIRKCTHMIELVTSIEFDCASQKKSC